jgi:hypothetical protein
MFKTNADSESAFWIFEFEYCFAAVCFGFRASNFGFSFSQFISDFDNWIADLLV